MPCDQIRELELEAEAKRRAKLEKMRLARQTIRDQAKKLGWKLDWKDVNTCIATKPNGDKINFKVLKDGRLKTTTDKISMENHVNAEQFLRNVARDLGGKWNIRHKHPGGVEHSHALLDMQ